LSAGMNSFYRVGALAPRSNAYAPRGFFHKGRSHGRALAERSARCSRGVPPFVDAGGLPACNTARPRSRIPETAMTVTLLAPLWSASARVQRAANNTPPMRQLETDHAAVRLLQQALN